ncbi:hypothetical protein MATL_G00098630 [Megalops atlanticus]|uniref:DUF4211 domain-containing protein n=1 Tax=Megalops atlanticus TaxID=7932 RepID=A0A9D3Q1B7_MEGAT|nr:hypothetical protein MATL_G00098630 [Megalops atlanticus]
MNRNYPTSSFAEPLASPVHTAAWAYERSSTSIKTSSSYGATQPESEHLPQQTYASPHQLPTYIATHHPGLSGIFETGLNTAGSNTTEASVMNFLSALESRTQQAGPSTASLLPQFRAPSWQTGMTSSAPTELFVTGSLPSSGTFSTCQHPSTFPTSTLASTPSLALQDTTFSPSSNGLLPPDPLLLIKSTQATVPAAIAFDRLSSTVLSTSVPPQSSTYRSAQESAPHLLQPQFSLLPSALGSSQQASQPYSTSVFTGSIERALQRECSVIKHHQRPSSTQSVQTQLPGSTQHSLQGYLPSGNEVPFQDTSQQSAVPCSPIGDSTQNLPRSSPTQDYILMHPSRDRTENTSSPQPQKYLPSVQLPPFSSAPHSQALQNNRSSKELKPSYSKSKSGAFVISRQEDGGFPIQHFQGLQQQAVSLDTSAQSRENRELGIENNDMDIVSKMEDRFNSQSVIRSNSRPEDQIAGVVFLGSKKDERMDLTHHKQDMVSANRLVTTEMKNNSSLVQASLVSMNLEELNQHSLMQKVPESQPQSHQLQGSGAQQQSHNGAAQQAQYLRLPGSQVLIEPSREVPMILLQQPVLHPGLDPSKTLSSPQMQQVPVQYVPMDDQIISTNVGQSQQQVALSQNLEVFKMDTTESSRSLQQHVSPKDNFSQANRHDAKHHFTLSSICFPDSILLADERNILSNVDDILAATVVACGVTPQDFVKTTSSEGDMPLLASPADSKGHLQLDTRQTSRNFSSHHSSVASAQTLSMTLNGGQLDMDIHHLTKGAVLEHQTHELPNSHTQSVSSRPDMSEKTASTHSQRPEGENMEGTKEKNLSQSNGADFSSEKMNGSDKNTTSDSDIHLAGEDCDSVGLINKTNVLNCKDPVQCSGMKNVKMENTIMEFPTNTFPKKKAKSKVSTRLAGEEENGHPKPVKRNQGKRQNSRGSDTNSPSTSDSCYDGYQQQERMRQKILEVEEKQPEVKTGFIGSFLDFLKSGPKQQFSSTPIRMPNRSRKSSASSKHTPCPLPLSSKAQLPVVPLMSQEADVISQSKRLDEELKKNLQTLPSFSSDEDESVGKNQDLQKSINSALSALEDPSERKNKLDITQKNLPGAIIKQEQSPSMPPSMLKTHEPPPTSSVQLCAQKLQQDVPSDQLAEQLMSVAIEGLTDEDLSDSGGEGMYRERDEFVVKNEDIECLKMTLKAGWEPPAIWKVQKALLQKFVPELRNGTRVFSATNSYLGYFGDAKTMYRRVYVKFIDTVNKREYVRVCSRKPRCKPMHSMRGSQAKSLLSQKAASAATTEPSVPKHVFNKPSSKPKARQPKVKLEPPPKKRKKWKEEFSSPSESSPEAVSEDDEFTPPVPFASRFLNTRNMKETFRSYVELLISVALDAEVMEALEKEKDELLLPHMRKVEGMLTDNRRRLLPKLRMGQLFKNALDSFPEFSLVKELKNDGETPSFKIRLGGKAYNKKTMRPSKAVSKLPLEYTVDKEKTQWFSLYHSLQHYKYHTYLICKDEIASLQAQGKDLGQEETVQLCMRNGQWVEKLFDKFGELLTHVQQTCL